MICWACRAGVCSYALTAHGNELLDRLVLGVLEILLTFDCINTDFSLRVEVNTPAVFLGE